MMISACDIARLINYKADSPSVISFYLDLRAPDYLRQSQNLIRESLAKESHLKDCAPGLKLIADFMAAFSRGNCRSLAIFTSREGELWHAIPLPQPVKSSLHLENRPYLRPLANILDQYQRYGIVLLDADKARFMEVFLGQIEEYACAEEDGEAPPPAIADSLHWHLKTVADQLIGLTRVKSFDRVILGAPADLEPLLIHHLHSRLQDNLILDAKMDARMDIGEILERVQCDEKESHKLRESVLVCRLLDAAKSNRMGVLGMAETLPALQRGEARMILVQENLARMGRVCPHCGALALSGKKCAYCWRNTEPVFNLVEEIVQKALDQNCEVYRISHDPRLDVFGGIGAELRFKTESQVRLPQPA